MCGAYIQKIPIERNNGFLERSDNSNQKKSFPSPPQFTPDFLNYPIFQTKFSYR